MNKKHDRKNKPVKGKKTAKPVIKIILRSLAVAGVMLLVGGTVFLVNIGLERLALEEKLAIKTVRVEGKIAHLDKQEIQQLVAGKISGAGYFSVDLESLRKELQAMEWMQSASVTRVWPGTLDITVIEKVPVAIWNREYVISNEGQIFNPGNMPGKEQMPSLQGPDEDSAKIMEQYLNLTRLLRPLDMEITSLQYEERQSWTVTMENGLLIKVDDDRSLEKISGFIGIYTEHLRNEMQNIASIDLRYDNGMAVKWKNTQAVASL